MFETLKEMGKVCENKRIGEFFKDFHRRRFNELYLWNREQAEAHQKQFMFWSDKVKAMDEHIKQLHERIREAA